MKAQTWPSEMRRSPNLRRLACGALVVAYPG